MVFPLASFWIRSPPSWLHFNLITSLKTLSPNTVTLWGPGGIRSSTCKLWEVGCGVGHMIQPIKDNWLTLNMDWIGDGIVEFLLIFLGAIRDCGSIGKCHFRGINDEICRDKEWYLHITFVPATTKKLWGQWTDSQKVSATQKTGV